MSIALAIFAIILGVLGIVGSIVPALPGPPLSWFGLLLMFLRSHFMQLEIRSAALHC